MGNWRTVHVSGRIDAAEVAPLRAALTIDIMAVDGPEWGPLCFTDKPSLAGLNDWPGEQVERTGNLFERGFDVEDIAAQLQDTVLPAAPSTRLEIHCGGEWESKDCVATIVVGDGQVVVEAPRMGRLPEISDVQIMGNLLRAVTWRG